MGLITKLIALTVRWQAIIENWIMKGAVPPNERRFVSDVKKLHRNLGIQYVVKGLRRKKRWTTTEENFLLMWRNHADLDRLADATGRTREGIHKKLYQLKKLYRG